MTRRMSADPQRVVMVPRVGPSWPFRLLWAVLGFLVRHRLAVALVVVVIWWYRLLGPVWFGVTAGALVVLLVGWRVRWPVTFARFVGVPARSMWRGWWVYRRDWEPVLAMCGLTRAYTGVDRFPVAARVTSYRYADHVRVRLIPGLAPADFERAVDALAHGFGARSARVYVLRPGVLRLTFARAADPLAAVVDALPIPAGVDLTAVPVGRCEDGRPWLLRLLGTHVLVAGVTGAGKGSVLWSLLRGLLPAIHGRTVQVWAVDPKGGMELAIGRRLFARFVTTAKAAADLLEAAVAVMDERAARLAGSVRSHTPTAADPLIAIVLDEIATLTAYLPDRDTRKRIDAALAALLSRGRSVGVSVVGALQDPRKEVLNLRNLFPTKIALRLDEPQQVDMVLGDGARGRGAVCDEIPESTPGVGFVRVDGVREPLRVRAGFVTDDDIRAMCVPVIGGPAPVPDAEAWGAAA